MISASEVVANAALGDRRHPGRHSTRSLPPSRRPHTDWLNAATIAGAIAQIGPTFGAATKIASIVFEDRGGRITIEDPASNGQAQTFDFLEDGATRAGITFQLDSRGARFSVSDVASLDEQMIAKLEAEAIKCLGGQSTGRSLMLKLSITLMTSSSCVAE
jgi:hypothetical protein